MATPAAGRGQLVPSMTHTRRPSPTEESVNVRANSARNATTSIDPSASASQVLGQRRRKTAVRLSRTNVLLCDAVNAASISSNKLS